MSRLRKLAGPLLLGLSLTAGNLPSLGQEQAMGPDQTTKRAVKALPADRNTPLPPRRLNQARLRELASQREFRYVEPDASTDAWDAFWARMGRWLGNLFSTRGGRTTWKVVVHGAMVAALVYAVLKLLQVDVTGAFGRSARRSPLAYDTESENIHEVDFASRIAEAEEAGNFRLATRLGYLEVLKYLTDGGFIDWQPDKTNHAYLGELPGGALREAFWGATREFEYVWYGELRLNAALYQEARAHQLAVARLLPAGLRKAATGAVHATVSA